MFARAVTGSLAADREDVQAGSIQISKLRGIENAGGYRQGRWQADDTWMTHFVANVGGADCGKRALHLQKSDAGVFVVDAAGRGEVSLVGEEAVR